MSYFNSFLHNITMYRLLSYGLLTLVGLSLFFSLTGVLQFSPWQLLATLLVLLVISLVSNDLLARLTKSAFNIESWLISALILFFILPPTTDISQLIWIGLAAVVAMASKYLPTLWRHPIVNPAAIGAVAVGLSGQLYASWWVATGPLIIPTLILGWLIIHKLHRYQLFSVFAIVAVGLTSISLLNSGIQISEAVKLAIISWPIIFLGSIMLTEPSTLPVSRWWQLLYAVLVAVLFASRWHIGPVYSTPELAIVLGNLAFFAINPKRQTTLTLTKIKPLARNSFEFIFNSTHPLKFSAGQYVELTLPQLIFGSKGNRRTFTIASVPNQAEVKFGIKVPPQASEFKQKLSQLNPGDAVSINQPAGQFTLPPNEHPVVMVAGGIGITPFISMIGQLQQKNGLQQVALVYQVNNVEDVAYRKELDAAQKAGLTIHLLYLSKEQALDQNLIQQLNATHPVWYISGPPAMVDATKQKLSQNSIKNIKTDYFSGY